MHSIVNTETSTPVSRAAQKLLDADTTVALVEPLPTKGYFVGGAGVSWVIHPKLKQDDYVILDILKFIQEYRGKFRFFGSWTDDQGKKWLSCRDHYLDLDTALFYATIRGEYSVWDIEKKEAVNVL